MDPLFRYRRPNGKLTILWYGPSVFPANRFYLMLAPAMNAVLPATPFWEDRWAVTIAGCYVSPEGVVLGADSTTTYGTGDTPHYYNHSQKLFEIGENSTLGAVTWGLGGLQISSHRTQFALLADKINQTKPTPVGDVASLWTDQFWDAYSDPNGALAQSIARCQSLNRKPPFQPGGPQNLAARTEAEERELRSLVSVLIAGFCIAGHILPDRRPAAFEVVFHPLQSKPSPIQKPFGYWFWGAPNMIQRLIFGCDDLFKDSVISSGKWTGTRADLDALAAQHALAHPVIPIRDAVDFIHFLISSTIKAFKFSTHSQICGGPIELAVITTDRRFRWVRHKEWDAAITEGEPWYDRGHRNTEGTTTF
jgi:hypothetical protein